MKITGISFDLPYSLRVDGHFVMVKDGVTYDLEVITSYQATPTMPGASELHNVEIINDDGNSIQFTNVKANLNPPVNTSESNLFKATESVVKIIANALVDGLKRCFNEHHLPNLYNIAKLGYVRLELISDDGVRSSGGVDAMGGGISIQQAPRVAPETNPLAAFLRNGAAIDPHEELYFEAKRYLLRGDHRMALANLAISFEVELASLLSLIAVAKGDTTLNEKIIAGTIGDLGSGLAKQALGHSLEERKFWDDWFVDSLGWLRTARNGVLHKALMVLEYSGNRRDFSTYHELSALFSERDRFMIELRTAVARVTAGQSPKP